MSRIHHLKATDTKYIHPSNPTGAKTMIHISYRVEYLLVVNENRIVALVIGQTYHFHFQFPFMAFERGRERGFDNLPQVSVSQRHNQ